MNDPGPTGQQLRTRVIELIPGEHYLAFTDSGDPLPDEDTIEELRVIAYARRNKGTLGPSEVQVIETLAEAVATGVLTNVIWAQCQAAKDYVDTLRSRRRERLQKAEDAARLALEAAQDAQVADSALAAGNVTVSGTDEAFTWQVSCRTGDKPVQFEMDMAGTVIDIMIRPRSRE